LSMNFNSEEEVRKWMNQVKNDRIINILVEKSNLTKIQFETFILDLIFRVNKLNGLDTNLKTLLRSGKDKVTRGAFNRTRRQALRNIVKSIYTVLLLGYLGIFETPQLEPFLEGANRLKSYIENVSAKGAETLTEDKIALLTEMIERELLELSETKQYYSD